VKSYYGGYFCQATAMTKGEYAKESGFGNPERTDPGYKIVIPSYSEDSSWCPADFFDKFFKELTQ
jgi:hypothetical protein